MSQYQINFEAFNAKRIVEKKSYSFKVENDFCDWEMALDGMETARQKLNKLQESND